MFDLKGKIAVVIGGAGGIGEACACALAQQGAKIVVASRNVDKLSVVVKKIRADIGSEAVAMQVDVNSEESVRKLADQVIQKFKTVDILVNAHGINIKMPSIDVDLDTWDSMFATNVRGVMAACKAFGKIMIAKNQGKIINISSVRGIRGVGGGNAMYCATKGAVDMITRCLAAEWASYHINVNAIGPSVAMTEMMKKIIPEDRVSAIREQTLFKRLCTPEDVAGACVYLASPESDFVTGQIMYVDGGLTAIG